AAAGKVKRALLPVAAATSLVAGCSRGDAADPYAEEIARREAFTRAALDAGGASRALGVASTSEVRFEEGFGILSFELDKEDGHASFTNHAFRWMGQNAHVRLKTHGKTPMKLQIVGWAHLKVIGAEPVISIYVDGLHLGSTEPIGGEGHYWIERIVPEWALRRPWVDLVIRTTAVGYHWSDPPELKVLNVYRFGWTEAN
ncbi:MAG: hypothetical protein KF782_14020, partial [Labilithrix sp.]|nr:hypothetical protein [Labilithrix sp.]